MMKTRIFFLFAFILGLSVNIFAQKITEEEVPQDVFISFKYKYPDATVSIWQKENENIYSASFKFNEQDAIAEFEKTGKWQLTRFIIKEKELPSNILTYYKENYRDRDYAITTSELHKNNSGETFYYLVMKRQGLNQNQPVELFFDLSGKLLRTVDPEKDKAENLQNNDNNNQNNQNNKNNQVQNNKPPANEVKPETIDPSKVPDVAKKHFTSKNKKAVGTAWYLTDKKYIVKFTLDGFNGQSIYSEEGVWIETRQERSTENLSPLMETYLKQNYRSYKIKTIEYVSQPKDKSFVLYIYDKKNKSTPPPITKLFFESNGKFRNVEKPDVADPNAVLQQKKQQEKDSDFMSDVDAGGLKFDNSDNLNEKVSKKELPTPIIQYLKNNFPEHKTKDIWLMADQELGNVYYLEIKKEGSKYTTDLYFDLTGKLLKKIDETEKQSNKNQSNQDDNFDNNKNQTEVSEDNTYTYGTKDEWVSVSEMPSDITKYIKKQYPDYNIKESYFKTENKLGNCYLVVLKRVGENKVTKVYFDLDGNVLKTEIENL